MALRSTAGERRHVVVVQSRAVSTTDEPSNTWSTFATIRCRIWQGKTEEVEKARRETGIAVFNFSTGYYPGITIGMRLSHKSRYFDITNVANIGELNREFVISATETK